MAVEAAGGDPLKLVYVPYDAGGKAMAALLAEESGGRPGAAMKHDAMGGAD